MTASQIIDQKSLERRVWELKNDGFIKGCLKAIEHILMMSVPTIIVTNGDWKNAEHKIDPKSQDAIAKWQKEIDDHIAKNYPDLQPLKNNRG